jgi:hypothetical protein
MKPHDLVLGVVVGAVPLVFGLVPGLFGALIEAVHNFRDSVLFGAPEFPRRRAQTATQQRPLWLAAAGAVFMAFTVIAYLLS